MRIRLLAVATATLFASVMTPGVAEASHSWGDTTGHGPRTPSP